MKKSLIVALFGFSLFNTGCLSKNPVLVFSDTNEKPGYDFLEYVNPTNDLNLHEERLGRDVSKTELENSPLYRGLNIKFK